MTTSRRVLVTGVQTYWGYRVARALVLLGETERAASVYRQWLADERRLKPGWMQASR